MTHDDFVTMLMKVLAELRTREHLRLVQSVGDRMFSTVCVGNEHAGLQFSLEWRDLQVDVWAYRSLQGRPPPRSPVGASPVWLNLREMVEFLEVHPLEVPLLTASGRAEDGMVYSTPGDLQAYLTDLLPLLRRLCSPWLRGHLESFEAAVRAREAALAEPEPGGAGATHRVLTEDTEVEANAPAFVVGVLEAWRPLRGQGWRDVWYAATPRKLALALTHPGGEVGVEVRVREPRPPEAHVELLLLEAGRPPSYERLERRVALRWALEARGAPVPQLERGSGVGLYAFLHALGVALMRSGPEVVSGHPALIREALEYRRRMEETLGAEFR